MARSPRPAMLFGIAVLVALSILVGSCGTVPYTERRQLLLLSTAEEMQLGAQAFQEVLTSATVSARADHLAMVERCGRRVAAVAERPDYQWEFKVIADPTINAFCLPGGKVAFYEGILPICRDETGVAVVMGHEVAHALARHGNERVSQGMMAELGTTAVASLFGGDDPQTKEVIAQGLGIGVGVGVILPFSRSQETEADHIGLILMAKAGYDPREAPAFWERMEASSTGARPPVFLSTHPSPQARIEEIRALIPQVMPYYEAARQGR